jgi:hypothetical protein
MQTILPIERRLSGAAFPLLLATLISGCGGTAETSTSEDIRDETESTQPPANIKVMPRRVGTQPLAASCSGFVQLTLHGGQSIPHVGVQVIYWGSNVNASVKAHLPPFYTAVTNSRYMDWLSEYGAGRGSYLGESTIQPFPISAITNEDIANAIGQQVRNGLIPMPDSNTVYMVYLPPGVTVSNSGLCSTACAYHTIRVTNVGLLNSVQIPFAVIPDYGPGGGCDVGCGAGSMLDNIDYASTHELIEAVTDPDTRSGWYYQDIGCEIGDRCNQQEVKIFAGGDTRTVETQWSNERKTCLAQVMSPAVCGRGMTGVFCGLANEPDSTTFQTASLWNGNPSDANMWNSDPKYWHTIQFPDVTGDGRADYCARGSDGIRCAVATLSHGTGAFTNDRVWNASYKDANGWGDPKYWGTVQFPDLNGDGKADVCGRGGDGIYCALSDGGNFISIHRWEAGESDANGWGAGPQYWATIQFPDLNGDGNADFCGRGGDGIRCALSNGADAFTGQTVWRAEFGDGAWNTSPGYWGTIQYADVNGDGKDDVCGRGVDGVYCSLSTGTTFGTPSRWNASYSDANGWKAGPQYFATIRFPDINGDGKADVCGRGGDGVWCAISNGSSAFTNIARWDSSMSDANGWASGPQYWATIEFPDVNGDGKADLCGRGGDGVRCNVSNGTSFGTSSIWGVDFKDANGWNSSASYWNTIQFPTFATYRQPRTWRMYANGVGGWLP